jgi:hypothetical protein
VYSGGIAAHAYKLLENRDIDRVILCGPSHRHRFKGASVYGPGVIWQTPLGQVSCDDQWCRRLLEAEAVEVVPAAHYREHNLEVQLPYLQTVLTDFRIVPIVLGAISPEECAEALLRLPDDPGSVIVASSDWQHYKPAAEGWPMDSIALECLRDFDPKRLEQHLYAGEVEACGGLAVAAVMRAARERSADKVKILAYGDSGDMTGDKSSVVGYAAAVIYKSNSGSSATPETSTTERAPSADGYSLSDNQKHKLLEIARQSIEQHLSGEEIPDFDVDDQLNRPGAAFVTLEKQDQLRGCIGFTQAVRPLYQTVSHCAVSAAVNDSRFPPVTAQELDSLHIEISVLTPLEKIASPDDIDVGRDGLMITLGRHRGLLLPQVAAEYGWTTREFLAATCRKAGLPPDAWKNPDAIIYEFQALIFEED